MTLDTKEGQEILCKRLEEQFGYPWVCLGIGINIKPAIEPSVLKAWNNKAHAVDAVCAATINAHRKDDAWSYVHPKYTSSIYFTPKGSPIELANRATKELSRKLKL